MKTVLDSFPMVERGCTPKLEVLMSSTVILAVGVDSSLLESQVLARQSAECIVTSVGSAREAFTCFKDGDFDIVLLGQSIPLESRERLTSLIRASGSRVPVACISDSSSDCGRFSDATLKEELSNIVREMGELMVSPARLRASREAKPRRAIWRAAAR